MTAHVISLILDNAWIAGYYGANTVMILHNANAKQKLLEH